MKKISLTVLLLVVICLFASCEQKKPEHIYVDGVCIDCLDVIADPTADEYFVFTELEDGTYSLAAKDIRNIPSTVVFPSTHNGKPVTKIAENAFSAREMFDEEEQYYDTFSCKIKTAVIPDSIQVIDKCAFKQCNQLSIVIMGDSVTTIEESAFFECNLKKLTLSNTLKTIGARAFSATKIERLVLPNSVTTVGDGAFSSSGLVSITIPASVTNFSRSAFESCSLLREVVNNAPIGFVSYPNISSEGVWLPNTVLEVHSGESRIVEKDGFWFYEVGGKNYLIRYSGEDTRLFLPSPQKGQEYEIDEYAFWGLHEITEIVVPEGVTTISIMAFAFCDSLQKVYFPKSVTNVAYNIFDRCTALTDVYYAGSEKDAEAITIIKSAQVASLDLHFKDITEASIHYNQMVPEHLAWW